MEIVCSLCHGDMTSATMDDGMMVLFTKYKVQMTFYETISFLPRRNKNAVAPMAKSKATLQVNQERDRKVLEKHFCQNLSENCVGNMYKTTDLSDL